MQSESTRSGGVSGRCATFGAIGLAFAWISTADAAGEPVALVESVENAPRAGVAFLDYVYDGQRIELGSDGTLELAYFDSCLVQRFRGGVVTARQGAGEVVGGTFSAREVPCQGERIYVAETTARPGAGTLRWNKVGTPQPKEWTVSTQTPIFVWPAALGPVTVSVVDLDYARQVWQARSEGGKLAYPPDAPPLDPGYPYRVTATGAGGEVGRTFSIDLYIDSADVAVAGVVPLR